MEQNSTSPNPKTEEIMRFKVVLEPQIAGGYTVYVPSLSSCVSQGESTQEAMANMKEAIELYLESYKFRNLPLPQAKIEVNY